jgi:translation initiation factor 1
MRLLAGTVFDRPPRCARCDEPEENCRCLPPEPSRTPPEKQSLRIAVEKRRKGKQVTVVRGLAADNDLPGLLTRLKTTCGAGGTLTDGHLEIQGQHSERIVQELKSLGYRVV